MARKKGDYSIGAKRKGHTHIESYEKKTNFGGVGMKRAGNPMYQDGRGQQQSGMNPDYAGGTGSGAMGNIPE
jgi:hypothetical protein